MKNIIILLSLTLVACEGQMNQDSNHVQADFINEFYQDLLGPTCPENHRDSIIPIVYGYPSEELFAKSDSGLVALGGCELADENYFCKIHWLSF